MSKAGHFQTKKPDIYPDGHRARIRTCPDVVRPDIVRYAMPSGVRLCVVQHNAA